LLKPNQNGVQASGSRLQLFAAGVKETVGQATSGVRSTQERWQQRRSEVAARKKVQEPQANSVRQSTEQMKEKFRKMSAQAGGAGQTGVSHLRERLSTWRAKRAASKEGALRVSSLESTPAKTQTEPSPALRVSVKQSLNPKGIRTRVISEPENDEKAPSTPKKLSLISRAKAAKVNSALTEAHEAISAEDYQTAEDLLIEYISGHTKDTKAYLLLGQVCLEREEWSEAMEVFTQVVKLKPGHSEAYTGLGNAALKAGKYTQALQALQRAHEGDPTNRKILDQLMYIAQRMDNPALQHSISEKLSQLVKAS